MDAPRIVMHRGVRILVLDYAGASALQLPALLDAAERVIHEQPPRSLLLLTRMFDCEFSFESTRLLLEHIERNGPYALASAVVGLGHLAAAVPIANRLTSRNLRAFEDEPAALDWLTSNFSAETVVDDDAIGFVEHDGCRILRIDFRGAVGSELLSRMNVAAAMIHSQPERSVLTLTLVHGVSYTREITGAMKEYVQGNRPYVLAGAVVGLDYLRQVLLPLNRLTGRNLRAFDAEVAAQGWLCAEARRFRRI